jgi:hypothetical protein
MMVREGDILVVSGGVNDEEMLVKVLGNKNFISVVILHEPGRPESRGILTTVEKDEVKEIVVDAFGRKVW